MLFLISSGALAQTVYLRPDSEETRLDHDRLNQEVAGTRDLKLYTDGGNFGTTTLGQSVIQNVTALRDFIWSHWKEKTRGYARLVISGTDNTVTLHIFIEPSRSGVSHIRWRGVNRWTEGAVVRLIFGHWSDAVVLERAQSAKPDRRDGDYVLVFKAADGQEVWRL